MDVLRNHLLLRSQYEDQNDWKTDADLVKKCQGALRRAVVSMEGIETLTSSHAQGIGNSVQQNMSNVVALALESCK